MSDEFVNPFVGPRTFQEGDEKYFYGRDREARRLLSLIISEPLVLFYATSGAGKSSLLNTRIIPQLRNRGFTVLPTGRVSGLQPDEAAQFDNVFVYNLLLSLNEDLDPSQLTKTTIAGYLQDRRQRLAEQDQDWVLIVDQFEEILTTNLDRWSDRRGFFDQIGQAMQLDPHLWVLLTLREDSVSGLDPYARILPGKLQARFYMQRLNAFNALKAIKEPAKKAGREFESEAALELVDNLRRIYVQDQSDPQLGEFVEPLQLQLVCYQLWENLRESPQANITVEDVDIRGNVDNALGIFYEDVIASVVQSQQISEIELRNWCEDQLITEAKTRNLLIKGEETTAGLGNEIVELLAAKSLIRSFSRAGSVWYELVHDRLIDPILQNNQQWRSQVLVQAAIIWNKSGRPESKLFVGPQLEDVLKSVDETETTPDPLVVEFLRQSEALNDRLIAEEEARKHELTTAQILAEEEKARAEQEVRISRRLRVLTAGLAIALVIFCLSVAMVFFAAQQIRVAEDTALEQELLLEFANATRTAETATKKAVALATTHYEGTRSACERVEGVASSFLNDWDPTELGCATGEPKRTYAAWQPFQNEQHMIWRKETDDILVFYFDESGNAVWEAHPDEYETQPQLAEPLVTPVPGQIGEQLQRPKGGFGYLWDTHPEIAGQVGWATDREFGFCALFQEFENGVLLKSDARRCTDNPGDNEATSSYNFPFKSVKWVDDGADPGLWQLQCSTCQNNEGKKLALAGDIETAVHKFEAARALDLEIQGGDWDMLCRYGSLWQQPELVINYCDLAVQTEGGSTYDSRGIAWALLGQFEAAIEDFTEYIKWADGRAGFEDEIELRRSWIEELRQNQNPLTLETLQSLRSPD